MDNSTSFNFKYPENIIQPQRLFIMRTHNICQFCENPEGEVFSFYLNKFDYTSYNILGFYRCSKDECNKNMENYIKSMFQYIYNSKSWKNIILKAVNQNFISVPRTSGVIDDDWKIKLKEYDDNNNKIEKYPLNKSFYNAILSSQRSNNILPQEIWMYIHDICISLYNKDIYLIFKIDKPCIMVCKDNIEKIVYLDTY
jgi:hypothetical protein